MKITKQYLKQVIKEELGRVMNEVSSPLLDDLNSLEHTVTQFGTDKIHAAAFFNDLQTNIENHPQAAELNNILDQIMQTRIKDVRSPKTGGLMPDTADPNYQKAVNMVQQMKQLVASPA